jgi:hypothetical protein
VNWEKKDPIMLQRDTAGDYPPKGANPSIHWNTYLQVESR